MTKGPICHLVCPLSSLLFGAVWILSSLFWGLCVPSPVYIWGCVSHYPPPHCRWSQLACLPSQVCSWCCPDLPSWTSQWCRTIHPSLPLSSLGTLGLLIGLCKVILHSYWPKNMTWLPSIWPLNLLVLSSALRSSSSLSSTQLPSSQVVTIISCTYTVRWEPYQGYNNNNPIKVRHLREGGAARLEQGHKALIAVYFNPLMGAINLIIIIILIIIILLTSLIFMDLT